jgi:hemerythrin-like domain-containing protein
MNELVDKLVNEHKQIFDIFKEIQKVGTSANRKIELFAQFQDLLLTHLEKENNYLYPPLIKKAESNTLLKKKLQTFGSEMEKITKLVVDFYQKYKTESDLSKPTFPKDSATFIFTLKNRMIKEEVSIFKEYENLNF